VKGQGDYLCACGHEWLDHAISRKGETGRCYIEGCDCKQFRGVDEDGPMKQEEGE
jgi:hypothetical protein